MAFSQEKYLDFEDFETPLKSKTKTISLVRVGGIESMVLDHGAFVTIEVNESKVTDTFW